MRIYISGPITGIDGYMENFDEAERYLMDAFPEAQIMNPAKINIFMPGDFTHDEYLEMSLKELSMCDAIFMLSGWRQSAGACMEFGYAYAKRMSFITDGRGNTVAEEIPVEEFDTENAE